jgi:hypothetical protein
MTPARKIGGGREFMNREQLEFLRAEMDAPDLLMSLIYEYGEHRWLAGRGEGQGLHGDMRRESDLACAAITRIRRLLGLPTGEESEETPPPD